MATHVGFGITKLCIILGAGYTGSILMRNGKLSDLIGELQALVKRAEKSGEGPERDSDYAEALTAQVRRLAMEVRQMSSPITVLNGDSGSGNATVLIVPAATLGALGYGYMWWKGISFSGFMYVTKRCMEDAVASMTKNIEHVFAALAATKRHLTQRIEGLDGKLDEQKEISGQIKNEVQDVRGEVNSIGYEFNSLQQLVFGLSGKMNQIEDKQNFICAGVTYLCQFVGDKDGKTLDFLKDAPNFLGRQQVFRGSTETRSLKGLQHITEAIESENYDMSRTEAIFQPDIGSLDKLNFLSRTSAKC